MLLVAKRYADLYLAFLRRNGATDKTLEFVKENCDRAYMATKKRLR